MAETLSTRKAVSEKIKELDLKISLPRKSAQDIKALYRASISGNVQSQFDIGVYYLKVHKATDEEVLDGVKYITYAYSNGYKEADYELGLCYLTGKGFPKDEKRAVEYLLRAVERGHSGAQYSMFECYYHGTGVVHNMEEAIRLCELSANQGNVYAQTALGKYILEHNLTKHATTAVAYLNAAADQNHANAAYLLGLCSSQGFGVPKDDSIAFSHWKRAADLGYGDVLCYVASVFDKGTSYAPQDLSKALYYYHLAAYNGNSIAQNNLGCRYFEGTGTVQSHWEAVKYFTLAAEQGNDYGQNNLGLCYKFGNGVAKNTTMAEKYFKLAADRGHALGQLNLGAHYWFNAGLSSDIDIALKYWKLAAEQGEVIAQKNLGYVYFYGLKGMTPCKKTSLKYFIMALKQKDQMPTVDLLVKVARITAWNLMERMEMFFRE